MLCHQVTLQSYQLGLKEENKQRKKNDFSLQACSSHQVFTLSFQTVVPETWTLGFLQAQAAHPYDANVSYSWELLWQIAAAARPGTVANVLALTQTAVCYKKCPKVHQPDIEK